MPVSKFLKILPLLAALLVLMTMGGRFLSSDLVSMLALLWFGLGAMIEFAFASRQTRC